MKKNIKKIVYLLLSNKPKVVTDASTNQRELARYWKIFGIVVKVTYEPLDECHHSQYLGIN